MNGLPYYKAYPRDFFEGTIGMPVDLKGVYRLVLDLIYMQGGALPDDARFISGLLGCSVRAWNGWRKQLLDLGKISAENGIISNFRASLELDNLKIIQEKQRQNGSQPKKNKHLTQATADPRLNHTEPDTEREKEETNVSSKKARASRLPADWVLPLAWGEWATGEGMTEAAVRHEAAQFRDYWLGASGKNAAKIDWLATWRKWCRTAMAREADRRRQPPSATKPPEIGEIRPTPSGKQMMWTGAVGQWVECRE